MGKRGNDRQGDLAAYHNELAALFAARRCDCGAPACIVCVAMPPAQDGHWCLPCAVTVDGSVDRSIA